MIRTLWQWITTAAETVDLGFNEFISAVLNNDRGL